MTTKHSPSIVTPEPGKDGTFQINVLGYDDQILKFHAPLEVEWWTVVEEPEKDGLKIEVYLNNGLNWTRKFNLNNPHPASKLDGFTTAQIEKSILRMMEFEFVHAFYHLPEDPNYKLLHWALYGNFKDQLDRCQK